MATLDLFVKQANIDDLKPLFEQRTKAKTELDEASDDQRAAKKTAYDEAEKKYLDKRTSIVRIVRSKIDMEREKGDLTLYSKEVAERRGQRKASQIEGDLQKAQGLIDIYTLDIAAIDRDIEALRKGQPLASESIAGSSTKQSQTINLADLSGSAGQVIDLKATASSGLTVITFTSSDPKTAEVDD